MFLDECGHNFPEDVASGILDVLASLLTMDKKYRIVTAIARLEAALHDWRVLETFKMQWPNHCKTCDGFGAILSQDNTVSPCPDCNGKHLCPRCSTQRGVFNMKDPSSGWTRHVDCPECGYFGECEPVKTVAKRAVIDHTTDH